MDKIKRAISYFYEYKTQKNVIDILECLREAINEDKEIVTPMPLRTLEIKDKGDCYALFTDIVEYEKGEQVPYSLISTRNVIKTIYNSDINNIVLNPWGESFVITKAMLNSIYDANKAEFGKDDREDKDIEIPEQPKSKIYVDKGDITRLSIDCIVNAANNSLLGGGGVDGAIHKVAGSQLLEECKNLSGCQTGEAKITKGYNLKSKYVIHTVAPVYSGKESDIEDLKNCYANSLDLARKNDIHTIAFPAIGTGAYAFPLEPSIVIAVTTAIDWMNNNKDYPISIIFNCFDDDTYDAYTKYFKMGIRETK